VASKSRTPTTGTDRKILDDAAASGNARCNTLAAGRRLSLTRAEKVKALVYVAALAPDEGETVADVFHRGDKECALHGPCFSPAKPRHIGAQSSL
jgi:hypothetical protein